MDRRIIFAITCAAVLALGGAFLWSSGEMSRCEIHQMKIVPGPGRFDALVEERFCNGVAGSDDVIISVSERQSRHRAKVFAYGRLAAEPSSSRIDGDPEVIWKSADRLRIDIDAVAFVSKRLDQFDILQVEYGPYETRYK